MGWQFSCNRNKPRCRKCPTNIAKFCTTGPSNVPKGNGRYYNDHCSRKSVSNSDALPALPGSHEFGSKAVLGQMLLDARDGLSLWISRQCHLHTQLQPPRNSAICGSCSCPLLVPSPGIPKAALSLGVMAYRGTCENCSLELRKMMSYCRLQVKPRVRIKQLFAKQTHNKSSTNFWYNPVDLAEIKIKSECVRL